MSYTPLLELLKVFRFGLSIATVANTVIGILKGETLPLLGSLAYSNDGPPEARHTNQSYLVCNTAFLQVFNM